MAAKIVFANQKGGCGKSTMSVLTAWRFAELGHRTLLVDLDPQGNASETVVGVDLMDQINAADELLYEENPSQAQIDAAEGFQYSLTYHLFQEDLPAPLRVYPHGANGIHVLPASINDRALAATEDMGYEAILNPRRHLDTLDEDYDVIIVDSAPGTGRLQMGSVLAADHVIMPLQLSPYPLSGPAGMKALLDDLEQQVGAKTKVLGIFVNCYNARSPKQQAQLAYFREQLHDVLMKDCIPWRSPITDAIEDALPVWRIRNNGNATSTAKIVLSVIDEIQSRLVEKGEIVSLRPVRKTKAAKKPKVAKKATTKKKTKEAPQSATASDVPERAEEAEVINE